MLAITRLGQEATDENMIVRYHKLNAFLLLTSGLFIITIKNRHFLPQFSC